MKTLILITALILTICVCSESRAETLIRPGESISISDPDAIGGGFDGVGCGTFLAPTPLAADCLVDPTSTPLNSYVMAGRRLARADSELFQYYTIQVDEGDGSESVLMAQVSGTVSVKGWMIIMGLAQSKSAVVLKVIDVTNGSEKVITSRELSSHKITGEFTPELAVGFGADVGIPHGGSVGGGIEVGVGLPARKEIIRDTVDFGFSVLLQRGHQYRLYLESTTSTQIFAGFPRGVAVASFSQFFSVPDNLVDIDKILDSMGSIGEFNPPNLGIPGLGDGGFISDVFGIEPPFSNTKQIANAFNIPITMRSLLERIGFGDGGIIEQELAAPGVSLSGLTITLQNDQDEILREVIRLLLTPQGRRQSNFIECQVNGNGNGNGNSVGSGCDFPIPPGQPQSGNSGAGSSTTVTVAASPGQSSNVSSGGGAFGLLALAALSAVGLTRKML